MVLCSCGDRAHLWVWRLHLGAARFSPQEEAPHTSLSSTLALAGGDQGGWGAGKGSWGLRNQAVLEARYWGAFVEKREARGGQRSEIVSPSGEKLED